MNTILNNADYSRAIAALDEADRAIREAEEAVAEAFRAFKSLPDENLVSQRRDLTPFLDAHSALINARCSLPVTAF